MALMPSTTAESVTLLVGALVSILGSLLLCVCCCRLRKHRDSLLVWQLLQLALVDLLLAIWQCVLNAMVIARAHTASTCYWYMIVDRVLLLLSILLSLALAGGMVLQLLYKPLPCVLWHFMWCAVPLALVFNVAFFMTDDQDLFPDPGFGCITTGLANNVYALEVGIIFGIMVGLHLWVLRRAWSEAPHTVARRSAINAGRYLSAYFVTHLLHIIVICWTWAYPDRAHTRFPAFRGLKTAGDFMVHMNGFFNLLAFGNHVWSLHHKRRNAVVTFGAGDNLQHVVEVPGESADRGNVVVGSSGSRELATGVCRDEFGDCLGTLSFARSSRAALNASVCNNDSTEQFMSQPRDLE